MPEAALGWVSEVVRTPSTFTGLVAEGRDGWVALHEHDYRAARRAFTDVPVGRLRADLALATLHDDLSRVATYGTGELFATWKARGSLPPGPAAPLVAALAASCGGADPAPWAATVTSGPDVSLAQRLARGDSPFDGPTTESAVGRRLSLHVAVRAGDVPAADLVDAAASPLLVQEEGDFRREFWDPCVAATLAVRGRRDTTGDLDAVGGLEDLPKAGLGVRLFAAWPTEEDVRGVRGLQALGTNSVLLDQLGDFELGDDVDAARDWVRNLDRALDHHGSQLAREADDDGRALLSDLRLVPRLRQEVVLVKAREALQQGHARQALALLEQARDPSEGLGAANAPGLYALLAEAHLRLARSREAMDALQPLVEAYPWLEGTRETLGDWAVLQGLDRRGDSKENP